MAIETHCPHCNALYNLVDNMAGERVRCLACREVFPVPPAYKRGADPTRVRRNRKGAPRRSNSGFGIAGVILLVFFLFLGAAGGALWIVRSESDRQSTVRDVVSEEVASTQRPELPKEREASDPPAAVVAPAPVKDQAPAPPAAQAVAAIVAPPHDPPSDVAKNLEELKAATVFIKVAAGPLSATGSGFVIRSEGDAAYVVTNHHVVHPEVHLEIPADAPHIPGRPGRRPPLIVVPPRQVVYRSVNPAVSVVFHSGSRQEFTQRAEVVATDPEQDLAILKVDAGQKLPRPIDIEHSPRLVETLPVLVFGFPFGPTLSSKKGRGNPEITVGSGTVSSIRRDDRDQVAVVQIDGALNPGNSGGPVVDKEGRLIGVAVATIRGANNIGLAIPAQELTVLLRGKVGTPELTAKGVHAGALDVSAEVPLIDPTQHITQVALHYIRVQGAGIAPPPDGQGRRQAIPGATRVLLSLERRTAKATFRVPGADKNAVLLVQASYVVDNEPPLFTEPRPINFKEARPPAEIAEMPLPQQRFEFPRFSNEPSVTQVQGARPVPRREPAPLKLPECKDADNPVGGAPRRLDDLTLTELNLDARSVPPCLCWSADEKSLYVLEGGKGIVRRIAIDGLVEKKRLEIDRMCSWLSVSAAGLLVSLPELQEVWILHPEELRVLKRIVVPGVMRAVSAPALGLAVATGEESLSVLDLKAGQGVKEYGQRSFPGIIVGFADATMSPNGHYVFTRDTTQRMHRFALRGTDLFLEESSLAIIQGQPGQIAVSSDSKYVCLPCSEGNSQNLRNHPHVNPFTTYVYPVDRLSRPAFTLVQGPNPQAVAFGPRNLYVCAQNANHALILFNIVGLKRGEYTVPGIRNVRQFLPYPAGHKVLVHTGDKLVFAELPGR